jgi:hypothetical protein
LNYATATYATKQQATGQAALTGASWLGPTPPLAPTVTAERYPTDNAGKESR